MRKKATSVIATTGYTDEALECIKERSRKIPVFYSANMSLGIALLARLIKQASRIFPNADVEIIEKHHNLKLDAPRGTALLLADAIKEERQDAFYVHGRLGNQKREANEIGIHALRLGNVIGEHEVIFSTDSQSITLSHSAHDRALFAEGALRAADFLLDKPVGFYNMEDLLDKES